MLCVKLSFAVLFCEQKHSGATAAHVKAGAPSIYVSAARKELLCRWMETVEGDVESTLALLRRGLDFRQINWQTSKKPIRVRVFTPRYHAFRQR